MEDSLYTKMDITVKVKLAYTHNQTTEGTSITKNYNIWNVVGQ